MTTDMEPQNGSYDDMLVRQGTELFSLLTVLWILWLGTIFLGVPYYLVDIPNVVGQTIAFLYVVVIPLLNLGLSLWLLTTTIRLAKEKMRLQVIVFLLSTILSLGLLITYAYVTIVANQFIPLW
jgi:hypothetical protein